MSPSNAIKKSDIKSIMTKYTDNTPDEGDVEVVENREYEYADVKGVCKWVFNRELEEEEETVEEEEEEKEEEEEEEEEVEVEVVEIKPKKKVATKKKVESEVEAVQAVEAVEAVKAVKEVKAPKAKAPKEKVSKEDIWVTFKDKIVNGDDIDECIDMVKKAFAKKTKRNGKDKQTRKPSSYNNFVSKTMMELKNDDKLGAQDRLSIAAKRWKALSPEEKAEFKANDTDDGVSEVNTP